MHIGKLSLLSVAIAGLTIASSASATPLPIIDSGLLQITDVPGTLLGLSTSPLCLNWGGGFTCVTGTTHQMAVSGSSIDFATTLSATDQIKDVNTTGPVVDFETVLGAGPLAGQTVHFDLTSLATNGATPVGNCSGAGANNAFNSCTPAFSMFTLTEDALGRQVTIQFSASLEAYTGTSGTGETPYIGVFDTQVSGTIVGAGACNGLTANITNILSCEAAGGTIQASWSATESPDVGGTVPEPASTPLAAAALVAMGWCARRWRRA